MKLDEIETVAILVQLKNGNAHQVLTSKMNKQVVLNLISNMDNGLKLSQEIEPVVFEPKQS